MSRVSFVARSVICLHEFNQRFCEEVHLTCLVRFDSDVDRDLVAHGVEVTDFFGQRDYFGLEFHSASQFDGATDTV